MIEKTDYEKLLLKYIEAVEQEYGTDAIDSMPFDIDFSLDELKEIKRLTAIIINRRF